MIRDAVKIVAKKLVYRTPFGRFLARRWDYNFSPRQLAFLASCIDRTAALSGSIAEVGCFVGATTVWLSKHMEFEGIDKPYYALDTFSGFVPAQSEYEIEKRGKRGSSVVMQRGFAVNSKFMFDRQLEWNGLSRVESIEADAATFDYATLGPLSFVLVDVDLYLPVKAALERIHPLMQAGGIIVVDDCAPDQVYDGALQAYEEFIAEHSLPRQIVHGKLGLIEIGSAVAD